MEFKINVHRQRAKNHSGINRVFSNKGKKRLKSQNSED